MLRVGLTGGIACGKSTIAAMLVKRGAHFLQADALAHQLYAPGAVTYDEVVRHFGREILNEDGTINRTKLANLVFPDRIGELNAIVHPEVVKRQNSWMAEVERNDPARHRRRRGGAAHRGRCAQGLRQGHRRDLRLGAQGRALRAAGRRIRSTSARAEVERRSAAQFSDEEKARHADYVIENSGSLDDAERQVEKIWQELQSHSRPLTRHLHDARHSRMPVFRYTFTG